VEPQRPGIHRGIFDDERLTSRVGDKAGLYVELGRSSLRSVVVQQDVTIDPVPLTIEVNGERLDDVEGAVRIDGEQRVETAEANGTFLRTRINGDCAENDGGEEGGAADNA
jgi:hypothetical protein